MKRFLVSLIIPIGLAASSTQAASSDAPPTRVIGYDERELHSTDNVKTLLRRINMAADQVCADPNGPSPAITVNQVCRAEAVGNAHQQLAEAVTRPNR
jgi:UrcA family protein